MVLACESIFSRTSLDARPQNLHTFSKENPNYRSILAQWGKQDTVFTCPTAIIYKFYLPGASTNVEPCHKISGHECVKEVKTLTKCSIFILKLFNTLIPFYKERSSK